MVFHERVRQVPKQFSWLDQRLVQECYIDRLSHPAMGLYLFLVTVGDANGVSFYADKTLQKRLRLSCHAFEEARLQLITHHLIAHQQPFYQVLELLGPPQSGPTKILTSVTHTTGSAGPTKAQREIALRSLAELAKKYGTKI